MIEAKEMAEIAKKRAETAKKLEAAERKLKTQENMLTNRLNANEAIGTKHIDVKYAAREVERLSKELDRLK